MAVAYDIQADVIDIKSDVPLSKDAFLVDTNVWFWTAYPGATQTANHYQTTNYPDYLNKALAANADVFRVNLSLAELSHTIENTEYKIYNSYVANLTLKEYRHNIEAERKRIVNQIQTTWGQVQSLASPLDLEVNERTANSALARLQSEKVDGYDLFILEAMQANGVSQVVTDDGDFVTVPGIQVFTANRNVINAAKGQGKLIIR